MSVCVSQRCLSRLLSSSRCIARPFAALPSGAVSSSSSVGALPRAQAPGKRQGWRCMSAMPHATLHASMETFEPASLPATSVSDATPQTWEGDLLIVAVTEEDFAKESNDSEVVEIKSAALKALDSDLGSALSAIISEGGFEGKQGSSSKAVRIGAAPAAKAKYVALVGLGKAAKLSTTGEWGPGPFQALGSALGTLAKTSKSKSVALAFASPPSGDLSLIAQHVTTGALVGGYETTRFKSKKSPTASKLEGLHLLGLAGGEAGMAKGRAVASGTFVTRFLVEAPPNVCTPSHLAAAALHLAQSYPSVLSLKVLEKADCEALGMGSYLGVSESSEEPPKFIHLTYKPTSGAAAKKVALVGKGLTFDSGGYNIKAGPGSMIEMMKFDMGGAGATLGAARIIAEMQPAGVEVHFVIAACENMIAGKGLRPGDILTAASGKTIEVNNTDAEGRLTLADALWYVQEKCEATAIVDSATLTGACMVALGLEIAGLFTPSDKMAEQLSAASKAVGEKVWRMPMENNYWDAMKSPIADMKNSGSRFGGSITAALFLKQFVKDEVEWAHLDVAGPVWDEKGNLPTGFGAATLAEWVMRQA